MFKFEMSTENVFKARKVLPVAKIISGFIPKPTSGIEKQSLCPFQPLKVL